MPRNRHFLINFMKTEGFKSTSFAGSTSRRDFRRSFPSSLINIFRGNLKRVRLTRLLFLSGSEIDRCVAGALDNRSRRTSRSRRVSALGNLSAPVNCSGCNLSLLLGSGKGLASLIYESSFTSLRSVATSPHMPPRC